MFRLLKEVFKSLSQNKIIMIGLSILIFLSSGVFTLVSNVRNNYDNEFTKYKQQSVLQDATVDLNVNFLGKAENNGFDLENKEKPELRTYYNSQLPTELVRHLEIPKNVEYISLANLGAQHSNAANVYIKSTNLSAEYLRNTSLIYNDGKSTIFNLINNTFKPNVSGGLNFELFTKSHSGAFVKLTQVSSVIPGQLINLDREYRLDEIAKVNRGERELKLQIMDDYLSNFNNLYINAETKDATFDFVKSKLWADKGALITISGAAVAKILNFEASKEYAGRFYLNKDKAVDSPSDLFITNEKTAENTNSIWGMSFANKVALNPNAKTITRTLTNYGLSSTVNKNVNQFYNFKYNTTYTFSPQWSTQTEKTTTYVQNKYALNYSPEKNNWTGVYKKYIENLKDFDKKEYKKFLSFSYWEKNIEYKNKDGRKTVVKQSLTNEDLQTQINLKSGAPTTIQEVESLSNEDVKTSRSLEVLSDANIKDTMFLRIKTAAAKMAKTEIVNEILKPQYEVNKIGIRQTITAKSINDATGQSQVYQFINAGDNKQQILGQTQEVGKLYQENQRPKNQESKLFIESAEVDTTLIESIYVTKIVDSIFKGFVPDKKYLNANIRYVDYISYTPETKIPNFETMQKIVVLSSLVSDENNYAIGQQNGKFVILKRLSKSQKDEWAMIEVDEKYQLDYDEVHAWVVKNELSVDGDTGESWLKQDDVYKNIYFLPMEYYVPKASILKQAQEAQSLEIMFSNVANFLVNSSIVTQGFFAEEDIIKLFGSIREAMENNKFYEIFKKAKINPNDIQKIIFEALFLANEKNGEQFVRSIIVKFIENFKNKIKYSDADYKVLRSLDQQKEFFKNEVTKLITFLEQVMGIEILKHINESFSLSSIISFVKSPAEFLESLVKLIDTFDLNGFIKQTHNWYQIHWNKQTSDGKYYSLSTDELLLMALENVNEVAMKDAFANIIDIIDFKEMLDPNSQNSLYFNLSKGAPDSLKVALKELFKKLNATENKKPYENISKGLKDFIALIDFKKLTKLLRQHAINYNFRSNRSTEEGSYQEVIYTEKKVLPKAWIAGFIKSVIVENNFSQFQDILVKSLNLSGKVADFLILLAPAYDEEKLDISSLAILSELSGIAFEKMKQEFNLIHTKFKAKEHLSIADLQFIKTYLTSLSVEDLGDNQKVSNAFLAFESMLNKFLPYAYLNDSNPDSTKWNLSFNINPGRTKTLGDYLVEFKEGVIGGSENSILNTTKKAAASQLGGSNTPSTPQTEAITIFGLWLRFAADHPELTNTEIKTILERLFALATNGSQINALLNDISLNTKLYTQEVLNNSSVEDLKVTVGQILPRELSERIWAVQATSSGASLLNYDLRNLFGQKPFNQKILEWMVDNREAVTSYMGLLAAGSKNKNNFVTLNNNFVNQVFGKTGFSKDEITLGANMAQMSKSSSQILEFLGLPKVLISGYLSSSFPEVAMWTVTNPNNDSSYGNGNLEFIVKNRIFDFSKLSFEQISDSLVPLVGDEVIDETNLTYSTAHEEKEVSFNLSWLNWIRERAFNTSDGNPVNFFGINLESIIFGSLDTILERTFNNRTVLINDNRSYSAKISEAFASKNGKQVYQGEIPKNSIEIERLLETIDEKYTINVGGVKFLIIGFDAVVDYIYPVIDEENLQVDVKNQALVFVNQQGFDRISNSFRGNAIKEYILVKLNNVKTRQAFVDNVNTYISNNFSSISMQKAFLAEELDPINPERSLRVSIVGGIISSINAFNLWIIVILSLLVTLSVLFIIKRYISVRGKVLGILRAQGYGSFKIGLSFTVFAVVSSSIGGFLGYGFGLLTQNNLMEVFSSYWTIPTPTTTFNWLSLIATVFLPFIMMSTVIILTSLWVLRKKPIQLMSGIVDINVGNFARAVAKPFKKSGVKTKFIASLGINSFWKLIVLMISTILTSFAMIFSISSTGILDKSVESTYANRNYKYKMNLLTPTTESGGFVTYNKNDLDNLLYTPMGQASEAQSWSSKFFKPGWALINGEQNSGKFPNGNPPKGAPHVVTKSSVDILINQGGLSISPWETVLNSMPDSQKSRTLKLSSKATKALEALQDLKIDENNEVYAGTETQKIDYFRYDEATNKFVYMKWDAVVSRYIEQEITTSRHRDIYRQFLVESYKKLDMNDFFVSFGGILFNEAENEKYSHAQVFYNDSTISINGYKPNSQFVQIMSGEEDLSKILADYGTNNEIHPLVVNQVVSKKYKIKIGHEIEFMISNHINKNLDKVKGANTIYKAKFKVIGINDTYINEEWTTSQAIVNKITGMDALASEQQFNGILSKEEIPTQLLESVAIYAPGGYWAATDLIDVDANSIEENLQYFEQIYGEDGLLEQNGISLEQRRNFISPAASNLDLSRDALDKQSYATENAAIIREALTKYNEVYGANLYSPIAAQISSKDIEISFIGNISQTINYISISLIILFFLISMVILVMISTMMIAENEKNIAIFSILGYTSREKIILFFTIYAPVIILATLLAAPLVIGFVAIFNSFLISSSSIAIPLFVKWWHVIISMSFTFVLFSLTSILSWISLSKIKAIHLLKGK